MNDQCGKGLSDGCSNVSSLICIHWFYRYRSENVYIQNPTPPDNAVRKEQGTAASDCFSPASELSTSRKKVNNSDFYLPFPSSYQPPPSLVIK